MERILQRNSEIKLISERVLERYRGFIFTVDKKYYEDESTGLHFTTITQEKEWLEQLKDQYYSHLHDLNLKKDNSEIKTIKNIFGEYVAYYKDTPISDKLVISKDSCLDFLIKYGEILGEGRTEEEAVCDLIYKTT